MAYQFAKTLQAVNELYKLQGEKIKKITKLLQLHSNHNWGCLRFHKKKGPNQSTKLSFLQVLGEVIGCSRFHMEQKSNCKKYFDVTIIFMCAFAKGKWRRNKFQREKTSTR